MVVTLKQKGTETVSVREDEKKDQSDKESVSIIKDTERKIGTNNVHFISNSIRIDGKHIHLDPPEFCTVRLYEFWSKRRKDRV